MAPRKTKKDTEEHPDAGTEGLHPRKTLVLYGQARAENAFLNAFNAGTLHHAWLLTGERGIGKATFAYRAARFLISQGGCLEYGQTTLEADPQNPVTRQIAARAHPSLFVLGDEDAASGTISVESTRKLRGFLSLTSTSGWRAVIVDAANDLTGSSANALLKAIEEPPAKTVFFLVSHGSGSVLPTIRSRCIRLALQPLNRLDLESAILAACATAAIPALDPSALERLAANVCGSPGKAMSLLTGDLLSVAEKLDQFLAALPKQHAAIMHELVNSVTGAKNAEAFIKLCDLIEERVEQRARKEALTPETGAAAHNWAKFWEKFREQRLEVESLNLDKGAFLIAAFSDIERAAWKASRANLP